MTAGVYAARVNLKILVLDRGPYGGQMNNTDAIDNYPGFSEIKGPELSQKMYDTMMKFEPDYKYGNVQSVELDGEDKLVKTDDGRSEEHTSELQSRFDLVCRLLLEKKK